MFVGQMLRQTRDMAGDRPSAPRLRRITMLESLLPSNILSGRKDAHVQFL